jgi:phospholipid N-methyltransferase
MNNKGALLKELFTNLSTTGAITFSSKSLVNKMLSYADFKGAKLIVELGGGDGSITQGIVERMDPDAVCWFLKSTNRFVTIWKKFSQEKCQNNL